MPCVYLETIIIYASSLLALVWALYNAWVINNIKVGISDNKKGEEEETPLNNEEISKLLDIGQKISEGANAFLFSEYSIMAIFIALFSIVVLLIVDVFGQETAEFRFYATFAFIVGSVTSILCGFIGMRIAVVSNYRTTFKAKNSLADAFTVAYRAGCVMGF